MMPYGYYRVFTPTDLDAVVSYLESVPAVSNSVEAPVYEAALQVSTPPQADEFTGNGVLGADAGTVVMEQSPGGTEAVKLIR